MSDQTTEAQRAAWMKNIVSTCPATDRIALAVALMAAWQPEALAQHDAEVRNKALDDATYACDLLVNKFADGCEIGRGGGARACSAAVAALRDDGNA